jgi:hypothetical protein
VKSVFPIVVACPEGEAVVVRCERREQGELNGAAYTICVGRALNVARRTQDSSAVAKGSAAATVEVVVHVAAGIGALELAPVKVAARNLVRGRLAQLEVDEVEAVVRDVRPGVGKPVVGGVHRRRNRLSSPQIVVIEGVAKIRVEARGMIAELATCRTRL